MKNNNSLIEHKLLLHKKYKHLIEQAYNFKQIDASLSDFSEYKAIKLLNKLNKLKYLDRNN